jgi:hypothetical protein
LGGGHSRPSLRKASRSAVRDKVSFRCGCAKDCFWCLPKTVVFGAVVHCATACLLGAFFLESWFDQNRYNFVN